MAKTIRSTTGRIWLLGVVGACFIVALISLGVVSRGGAISTDNLMNASIKFLGFYVPLISLIGTFLFKSGDANGVVKTPKVTFLTALFITFLWVFTPIMLLLTDLEIEDILDWIDKLIPVGQSLALMAIGYYFKNS
ncbi:MAG: hypothetical protein ABJA66_03880 [Actinomycetota bacterium]